MSSFGDKLKELISARGFSYRTFADHAGVGADTINRATKMQVPRLQGSVYTAIAKGLGMTPLELDRAWRNPHAPSEHAVKDRGIPIINKTHAGPVHDYQDVGRDNYQHLPILATETGDPDAFAIEVVGDSMSPEWSDGDFVICAPRAPVKPADACFIQLGPDAGKDEGNTFKRVIELDDQRFELRSDNPKYRPLIVHREHVVRIVKVIGKYVKYSWD